MAAITPAEQRRNRQLARQLGYNDRNGDGIPDVDPLSREELAAQYKSAVGIIYSVPEIRPLFEQALNEGWTVDRFTASLQETDWYRNNPEYYRTAWAKETIGGADWQEELNVARQAVQSRATQVGAALNGSQVDALARRFVYEGWGQSGRQSFLDKALSEDVSYLPDERGRAGFKGASGDFVERLQQLAEANGVNFSMDWYQSAARSVLSGLSTESDWERDVRTQAAGKWGPWGDRIKAGMNAYDIASPYISVMADTLELSPASIRMDDPYISQAMMGSDGQPMPIWDFQQKLRKDPRWMNTNYAQNQITGVADQIMQMFGLRG